MTATRATTRRAVLAGAAGLIASPAIIGRAAAVTRGVSDSEIVIGMMTDLSGVTAVQGTNAANSIRMAFDEINATGGINGRKIRFIVEDMEYLVPKAVQAMNKLVNLDNIFLSISSGGTPQMDAVLPMMIEKQVPSVFPLTCARSMYLPLSAYKYGQFSSYYDQMRACVKYFAETNGRKVFGSMYEDTDFGKDIHAGIVAQVSAMNLKLGAVATFSPTATDFNAHVSRLKDAGCDLVCMGTIVRDTIIILQTARKMGWDVDFCGQFASYSTAVAEAPGGPADGFYSMSPGVYAYPDDARPAVRAVTARYKQRFGIDINYLGEAGFAAATCLIEVLQRAGRDLNLDTFQKSMESITDWRDMFGGPPLTITPTDHHASTQSFLSVVKKTRWTPVVAEPLGY
ncbi:MAG TPA: ABC transporter substrate-binding protein [Acetobacteraceae bacterium]|nr:ABC transporter substrate-binding protein [Acetobacteraceae bacterium]